MISSTVFDPFNHGSSTIKFHRVSDTLFQKISVLLKENWKISEINKVEEHVVGPKVNSNNFKITASSGTYLLKASHINDSEQQRLINDCILYCEEENIAVPHIILTKSKLTYIRTNDGLYCLYDFIPGEHFDGSKEELTSAAREVANLTQVLNKIPFREEIKKLPRFSYHDPDLLRKVVNIAIKSPSKDKVDILIRKYHHEILKSSKKVSKLLNNFRDLPQQVVHGDLHPHNMMFDPKTKKLLAILDFDTLEYSPRIRSIAQAMHRLARTYGGKTEKKNDIGTTIQSRINLFLDTYSKFDSLSVEERKLSNFIVQDRELRGITIILKSHYMEQNLEWDFDLEKRITTLSEAITFL